MPRDPSSPIPDAARRVWEAVIQPSLRAGALSIGELRPLLDGSPVLGPGLDAVHAESNVGAFLRLYCLGDANADDWLPATLWEGTYRTVFGAILPETDGERARAALGLLVRALAGDGSPTRAVTQGSASAAGLFRFMRQLDSDVQRNHVLRTAWGLAVELTQQDGIQYAERRDLGALTPLDDQEWARVCSALGAEPDRLTRIRQQCSVWVHAEMTGADPDALLRACGAGIEGWRNFRITFLPYLRPSLAEIVRTRLTTAGLPAVLSCEDPRNRPDDEALNAVPAIRPTWLGRRRPTAERLLADIRRAAQLLGEPLTEDAFHHWCLARTESDRRSPVSAVRRLYGTWAAASSAAGVTIGYQPPSDAELSAAIRHVSERLNTATLSSADYKTYAEQHPELPSCSTILGRFATWKAACEAAGVGGPRRIAEAEMVEAMKTAAGNAPVLAETVYEAWRLEDPETRNIPSWVVRHRFGTWAEACAAAGLAVTNWRPTGNSEDPMLDALRRAYDEVGQPLTIARYEETRRNASPGSRPAAITIIKRLGTWKRACSLAGVRDGTTRDRSSYSNDEILVALQTASSELGRLTSAGYASWAADADEGDVRPSLQPILDRFGTWLNALEAAGIAPSTRRRRSA